MGDSTLEGKKIVLTGEPGFIAREEAERKLAALGAKVTGSVSGKTDVLIVGSAPGKTKLAKADTLGIPKLDAAGLKRLLEGSSLEDVLADTSLASDKTVADAVPSAFQGGRRRKAAAAPPVEAKPAKAPVKAPAKKKRFREAGLLTKLAKLQADYKSEKMVQEIEARVPEDQVSTWLWDAYGRGVLPEDWAVRAMLAAHLDQVPMDVTASALVSEAVEPGAARMIPGVPMRSLWLLFDCCRDGKAEFLREHVGAWPRPLQLAAWCALAGGAQRIPAPDDVVQEVRAMLPEQVLSGRMHGLDFGQPLDWLGISDTEMQAAIVPRLDEVEKLHVRTFGCLLYNLPRERFLPLVSRLDIDNTQPSWLAWWVGRRLELVDKPDDALAVFEALRPLIEAAPTWMRASALESVGLVIAKAFVEAGQPVPESLLTIVGESSDFVEKWMPVYGSLDPERLRAQRARLLAALPPYRHANLLPLSGLLGDEEVAAAVKRTEDAITKGNGVTNLETGLLGSIGKAVVAPIARRLDVLTPALPEQVNPYGGEYKKFAAVAGLRSALAVALGEAAQSGEEIDERYDDYLMPTAAVYGSHHDDHVHRFLMSDSNRMQKLFGALPDQRVRRFIEAWTAFDKSGKHRIKERLERVLPESRHALMRQGPSQAERLGGLAAETGLACTMPIYVLDKDESRQKGSLNTLKARPNGLDDARWPRAGKAKMEAALSLDLATIPELGARWPWARALCLFVDHPDRGFRDAELVKLDAKACESGFAEEGHTFSVEKVMVPPEVFGEREGLSEALETLREGLGALSARALGMPFFIQEAGGYESGEGFILQADGWFTELNLGDAGDVYVFAGGAFWQCH